MANIRNLVFDGAGVGVVADAGALVELAKQPSFSFKNITGVGGFSSGSIAALSLALELTPNQITEYSFDTDFKKFTDGSFLGDIERLTKTYGLYDPKNFVDVINGLFSYSPKLKKLLDKKHDITFGDLQELGYKTDLRIVATNLYLDDHHKPRLAPFVFSAETAKNTPIVLAIMASCAIPGVFPPVRLTYQGDGYFVQDDKGHTFIDGELSSTLVPINLFDVPLPKSINCNVIPEDHPIKFLELLIDAIEANHVDTKKTAEYKFQNTTLGFNIESSSELRVIKNSKLPVNLLDRLNDCINKFIFGPRDALFRMSDGLNRTIFIKNDIVSSTNFDITLAEKDKLFTLGQKAVAEEFKNIKFNTVGEEYKNKAVAVGKTFVTPKSPIPNPDKTISRCSCFPCFR